jgi:hypothetical protein
MGIFLIYSSPLKSKNLGLATEAKCATKFSGRTADESEPRWEGLLVACCNCVELWVRIRLLWGEKMVLLYPIGSMYAIYIYGNIYHQYTPYIPQC